MDCPLQVCLRFNHLLLLFSLNLHILNLFIFIRRKHKKGQEEDIQKKRTRRTQKFQRAVVGATITDILAKRNMKPEVRKAQREQAIR